jgi:hypothetical protein
VYLFNQLRNHIYFTSHIIFSTTYLRSQLQKLQSAAMNFRNTSAQTQNRLPTYFYGGLIIRLHIRASREWLLIICQYQVRTYCQSNIGILTSYANIYVATSTDVECVFSQGRLLLSHVCNSLSSQSTRALMCLGNWSKLGLVKNKDIYAVTMLAEVDGDEEVLEDGWDIITFRK